MPWSLNIGTIAGTAVRVHVTFLLFLGWIFVRELRLRSGPAGRLVRAPVHGAPVRLRDRARIRPHLHGARIRSVDAGRDAAADRRGGAARAHPGGALPGIPDRDRRSVGERRDRVRAGRARGRANCSADNLTTVERCAFRHDRPAGGREPVPGGVQHDPGVSDGRRTGAARAAGEPARVSCARPRSRPRSASGLRSGSGFFGLFYNPHADLHRHLRLPRGRLRGAQRGAARDVTRGSGRQPP